MLGVDGTYRTIPTVGILRGESFLFSKAVKVVLGGDLSVENRNRERATGPWILMASAGCGGGDATTNEKLAEMMGYIFGRRRAGR